MGSGGMLCLSYGRSDQVIVCPPKGAAVPS